MIHLRPFWVEKISNAWKKRSIVWLAGVRRSGKTTLARMFEGAEIQNCELPSVARKLSDPESFFDGLDRDRPLVLDEIHRLPDPSRVLKIAADAYPHLRVLATGSSTLEATRKFKDALTGRKSIVHLSPVLWPECQESFGVKDFDRRLLRGGLPEPLLAAGKDDEFFSEWIDSFYARDVQELFSIRTRAGFLQLLHLLLDQSGGLLDVTSLSKLCGLSRPTVMSHLEALRIAGAIFLLPPFFGNGRREITHRPKAYAFDTGFVTFARGWEQIRERDRGVLWEHLVLDALRAGVDEHRLHNWRDKSGREVDFVIPRGEGRVDAIECKINPERMETTALAEFRRLYPRGDNFVVGPFVKEPYTLREGKLRLKVINVKTWVARGASAGQGNDALNPGK